jgi:hypothetical protein
LEFTRGFIALPGALELNERLCREIDNSATSVILNVAEGNGRYSELDHHRFLDIASASVAETAAYLDLYERKLRLPTVDIKSRPGTFDGNQCYARQFLTSALPPPSS